MKTRIIVACIGVPVLLCVLLLAPLWGVGMLVGVISATSAWELLRCVKPDIHPRVLAYTAVCAYAIPLFSSLFDPGVVSAIALFALFVLVFVELMLSFELEEEPMDLLSAVVAIFAGVVLPVLLSSIVKLGALENGKAYMLLPFVAAFLSDSGAYFVGIFLGKHKLCPRLSPKKTIEGSIGGFVSGIVFMLIYGFVLKALDYEVNLLVMAVYGFLGSLACQLGDLCFSAIKRLCDVKDYGNLIPGHGGMLDRFDSMHWTAAMLWLLAVIAPAIK